ncbi:hypothetical protein [Amycolatopsis sp. SID8362]|uniref:hypothetical protein n=1 Tax=Amycolatopsis sp. SID8362 TaxID=2690346 RepID=UPI00136DFF41|nr:hypothetical protein [Amycolatopsis sp. SID8362]NBH11182.1 hypothetical protein [Amycolatopsis sp. SID8362]NED47874.1 hypothetical protein [Amycolatopsis sp. SID8362]
MIDLVHYIGLPYDGAPADLAQLVEALRGAEFGVSEPADRTVEAGRDGFSAAVTVESDGMVEIAYDVLLTDVVRAGRRGVEHLARLVGVVGQVADTYLGFISTAGEDLSFVGEERPVEVTEPLALFYFGRRYFDDWGAVPEFLADAEFTMDVPGGRVVVPVLAALG